VFALIRVRKTE